MISLTGETLLLDTNAIIYYLDEPASEIDSLVENNFLSTSIITEIEAFGYNLTDMQLLGMKAFFEGVRVHPISSDVKNTAIDIKRTY